MGIWTWVQPVDRVWKVVSDHKKGTIYVYNEKSELVLEKKGLSEEAMKLIEENFFDVIGTKLPDETTEPQQVIEQKPVLFDNPMYV